jgi:hypothetical protein
MVSAIDPPGNSMNAYAEIISRIRAGNRVAALAEIDRLLDGGNHDADLLGLKALALAMGGQHREAEGYARQAVAAARTPVQRLKHAGNLARLLASAGRIEDVAELARMELPPLNALAADDVDVPQLAEISRLLVRAGQAAFVTDYLAPVLDLPQCNWDLEGIWLNAAAASGQGEALLTRVSAPSYRWRENPAAIGIAAAAALTLKREGDANRLYDDYLAAVPAYASPRVNTQILTVVQITVEPSCAQLNLPAPAQHFRGNFPSQLFQECAGRYRFLSVFAGSPPRSLAGEIGAGEPALVLNNAVNGETLKRGRLHEVEAHEAALGLPVVNAAGKAVHCTRVETADMLRGIPNLIVPKAVRFRLEENLIESLRRGVRELFPLPVILRSAGQQEGANVYLARNDTELVSALSELSRMGCRDFYAIEYVGVEHGSGFFRRIRAAFVDGVPTVIRGDFDDQWMVRGRKFDRILDHYRRDTSLFKRANSVVEQPEQLGEAAWAALRQVGSRLPLDIFGMDFDVDGEGRVVFFEANATMLLLSNAPKDLDYPQSAQEKFLAGIDAFFRKKVGLSMQ